MAWQKCESDSLLEKYPNLKDFIPFLDVHNNESPRGAVLVACSFLDHQLKEIIDAFLIEDSDKKLILDGFNAPLGSFSARIKMAHCLGLISHHEKEDCETLRKIRNEYAHNHNVSFEDKKIVDLCRNLHHSAKDYEKVTVGAFGQFSTAAIALILHLVNRAHYVGKKRLEASNWPY